MATEPLNNVDSSLVHNITIRLIMQGKEVGSIIGKKGDNIKKIRIESGAKINISDGTYAERIVTVTGSIRTILKAFSFIAQKFEEQNAQNNPGKSLVTLKLIVPASQCGSLIGKGGSKIKEIREITGASIQVASEMLHNSTERAVTLAGNAESITKCIYQICSVMIESPAKGATIPYRPKTALAPVIFANGQAYTIQGQYAVHQPDLTKLHQLALQHAPLVAPGHNVGSLNPQVANLVAANSLRSNAHVAAQAAVIAAATPTTTNMNMSIPNEVIGCIIGKGGSKINEIRQLSGASIKITNQENGLKYRTVSITGTSESINLAQYLIHSSLIDQNNLAHNQPTQTTSVSQITQASTSTNNNNNNSITTATITTNGQQLQETTSSNNSLNNSSNNQATVNTNGTSNNISNNSAMIVDNDSSLINSSSNEPNNLAIQTRPIKSTATSELTGITKGINGNTGSSSSIRPNTPNSKASAKAVRKYAPY